jgi:hypothetical protein
MGYREWEALAAMALGEDTTKRMFPGGIIAERAGERLMMTSQSQPVRSPQ